ncbi:Panacea domain-containing protein [Helicobacter pullorum]|uniref:Panacea domain-containing protein n=1 Tax=Helicobacter pullorum TaxID=35818 RepID=UPI00174BB18C|nr:Panacea domain-containing protein [Helicobacter pullorum]
MVNALELSSYILKNSVKGLSNLELQKILYFTELAYIKKFNKHLIIDGFEAWEFGPIVRSVYYEYRYYGALSIDKPENENLSSQLTKEELEIIDNTIAECNSSFYWELVEMSKKRNGAWFHSFKDGKKEIISKDLIRKEAKGE